MADKFILAIDQSTASTKAIIFTAAGQVYHRVNVPHKQYYPQKGWVEHDAGEIYQNTLLAIKNVLSESRLNEDDIFALAITNQRETTVLWDAKTGKAVNRALVWQDNRSNDLCQQYKQKGAWPLIKQRTGLVASPYFCGPKAAWMVANFPEAGRLLKEGRLMFGTIDSWLVWNLSNGEKHITDYSNASRTMMFNLQSLKWDEELLEIYGLKGLRLPEVVFSDSVAATTSPSQGFSRGIPITGIMGDSHAALFGQNCFERGMAKATYGTGSSIMMNTGPEIIDIANGLVNSIGWGMEKGIDYVIEGNVNHAGDTIKWLVDNLELIPDSKSSEKFASYVPNNGGVYFVPAFSGLGAPYWDSDARAIITGISRDTTKAHIVRAAQESIVYQIKDIIDIMIEESGINLSEIRVDGGASRNDFIMQFQADLLGVPVVRSRIEELSAQGSAFMALLALGVYKDKQEIGKLREADRTFTSKIDAEKRAKLYQGWQEAIRRAKTT